MHPDGGIDANFYNECVLCKAEVGRLAAIAQEMSKIG
jgi:hypothetical protein